MSNGMEIAKAGWLHRQTSVLHRWKKNWFVLYRDGLLRYFDSEDSPKAEEVYVLRSILARVKMGTEVDQSISPPEGVSSGKACLFELEMRDGNNMVLCAESMDDMKAWQYALEEARTMVGPNQSPYTRVVPMNVMPGYGGGYPYYSPYNSPYNYGGYPGQVISAPGSAQVIQTPNGTTTFVTPPTNQVVFVDDHPYRRRRYGYYGAGTGFMAGAMLGSAMMYPYWW